MECLSLTRLFLKYFSTQSSVYRVQKVLCNRKDSYSFCFRSIDFYWAMCYSRWWVLARNRAVGLCFPGKDGKPCVCNVEEAQGEDSVSHHLLWACGASYIIDALSRYFAFGSRGRHIGFSCLCVFTSGQEQCWAQVSSCIIGVLAAEKGGQVEAYVYVCKFGCTESLSVPCVSALEVYLEFTAQHWGFMSSPDTAYVLHWTQTRLYTFKSSHTGGQQLRILWKRIQLIIKDWKL